VKGKPVKDIIKELRKTKPHHVDIDVEGQDDPEVMHLAARGKAAVVKWANLEQTLKTLDWNTLRAKDVQDNLIATWENPELSQEPEDKPDPETDPRLNLPPEDPDVGKYKVITAAQVTVLEQFNKLASITFGNYEQLFSKQDQLFEMVLSRYEKVMSLVEELERKRSADMAENAKAQAQMNQSLGVFGSILKEVAPGIAKEALGGLGRQILGGVMPGMPGEQQSDGGNGVPTAGFQDTQDAPMDIPPVVEVKTKPEND
jgi:hypothetical protein